LRTFVIRFLAASGVCFAWGLAPPAIQATPEPDRTISFFHIHTKESLTVTYKRRGRFDEAALKKLNWMLRDWRNDQVKTIDRRTIDIIWEMHTELGSKEPIHIISGYRSRATNNMLRRTRGGQASNSYHITGKAVDVHFPDVPVRYVRYAALIRQRGGVGYYPTSALPFVHVDTGRVRHWPRIKTDELALLFPNGRSRHIPTAGRSLRRSDVRRARARSKDLVKHVAAYHAIRTRPKTTTVIADAGDLIKPPKPVPAIRPPSLRRPAAAVAQADRAPDPGKVLAPAGSSVDADTKRIALAEPRPTRPATASPPQRDTVTTFAPQPSEADRERLNRLIAQATFVPLAEPPTLVRAGGDVEAARATDTGTDTSTEPSVTSSPGAIDDGAGQGTPDTSFDVARLDDAAPVQDEPEPARFNWGGDRLVAVFDQDTYTPAPSYDDDHPDELAYRPFPIGPLLTTTPNDPSLATIQGVEHRRTLEFLNEDGGNIPMQLRPPQKVAQLMWRQEFKGAAVQIFDRDAGQPGASDGDDAGLGARWVTTTNE
jgi:uncharacterized protein YcbK (DUF882 family)